MLLQAFAEALLWPGLGSTLAAALPEAAITTPDDVTVRRLQSLQGVSPARAQRLADSFAAAAPAYEVAGLLLAAGLPVKAAAGAVRAHGKESADLLRQDPWRLLDVPGTRLADADALARSLLPGASPSDPRRGASLVASVLTRAARDGSTCLPLSEAAAALAEEGWPDAEAALRAADDGERVVLTDDGAASLVRYAIAEEAVAEGLARLLATAEPLADPSAVGAVGKDLDEAQRTAVAVAMTSGVSVLTGGPGTGKSRTVAALVKLAQARGKTVALAAPTGRAAKRLEELCGSPATTLHRLLGAVGTTGTFTRGEQWPLDEQVVVVDEASMLDTELAAALVEAVPDGGHLLLVGDPAQLPSIGAGRVLGDLVDSGAVPVTSLSTLYRSDAGGSIARLATAVRGGELPAVDDPTREVVVVRAQSAEEAAHRTVQLVTDSIPRVLGVPPSDVQVVTPVHKGPAGTVALNAALKARLNPGSGAVGGFDVGDRVVATANHLEDGWANGDLGTVTGVKERGLLVAFAGAGPVEVGPASVSDLVHGWAVTVHRAQGSEFPAVVAVLPAEAGRLLSRPLVYTAFTRAQRHLSVVTSAGAAVVRAVREVGAQPRRTRLAGLLREAVEQL
ncbi:MAG: putative ATP-dependent exoDNAse [Frankiales bacterium]|nr:putative ATP-dependent exoDNAse [Frankiales bacterium]